jgi:signal transduction histidine kinase
MRRIVDREIRLRQRISRDLHDGAQQQLVLLLISLQLLRDELVKPTDEVVQLLGEATEQAHVALAGVREVVAGIHPSILTSRGLFAAVQALAERATLSVDVIGQRDQRFDLTTEAQAYFFVAEALANAVAHTTTSAVTVRINATEDQLAIEVTNDGITGAEPHRHGDDLVGLGDRVSALDGTFTSSSISGIGTTVRAEFVLGSEAR